MLIFAAPLAAVLVAVAPPSQNRHHRPAHHGRPHRVHATRATEAALRRDLTRMTRLALLEQRAALLHDFLVKAHTETPLLRDDAEHEPAPGIVVSTTLVSTDLLGSPIIRARLRSARSSETTLVLVAEVVDARGAHGKASGAFVLQAGETRIVELLCPIKLSPVSLIWSTAPL